MAAEAVTAGGHDGSTSMSHDEVHHDYHLVDPSPWPLVGSISGFVMTAGAVAWMHNFHLLWVIPGKLATFIGILGLIVTMFGWWRDVLREGASGHHKAVVSRGLRMGMGLFIASEVLFFFAFFWAFFWGALHPPANASFSYPPEGIHPVDAWHIPFLNTMILLLSGATVTWAHHAIRENDNKTAVKALLLTCGLGLIFTSLQAYEYVEAIHEGFNLTSGMYGSSFYMATGFHGFHVIVGTTFLIVCLMRAWYGVFRAEKHVGFEAASWYWHFVDVVWLFLFVWVYWWGGTIHFTVTPPA